LYKIKGIAIPIALIQIGYFYPEGRQKSVNPEVTEQKENEQSWQYRPFEERAGQPDFSLQSDIVAQIKDRHIQRKRKYNLAILHLGINQHIAYIHHTGVDQPIDSMMQHPSARDPQE